MTSLEWPIAWNWRYIAYIIVFWKTTKLLPLLFPQNRQPLLPQAPTGPPVLRPLSLPPPKSFPDTAFTPDLFQNPQASIVSLQVIPQSRRPNCLYLYGGRE